MAHEIVIRPSVMVEHHRWVTAALLAVVCCSVAGCSDDEEDGLSSAQLHGVGAACTSNEDCYVGTTPLQCLPFKGGYCGIESCRDGRDCPEGSACVIHDDGQSYCFLVCTDKSQCNYTRPANIEANCSSSVTFVDRLSSKACVPPS